jgi:hypothetical protein
MTMAGRRRLDLLSNASATGAPARWPGGRGSFLAEGSFGGASVSFQVKGPNGSWLDVGAEVTLTAPGVGNFELPEGDVRAAVAGGSPSGLYAVAVGV